MHLCIYAFMPLRFAAQFGRRRVIPGCKDGVEPLVNEVGHGLALLKSNLSQLVVNGPREVNARAEMRIRRLFRRRRRRLCPCLSRRSFDHEAVEIDNGRAFSFCCHLDLSFASVFTHSHRARISSAAFPAGAYSVTPWP